MRALAVAGLLVATAACANARNPAATARCTKQTLCWKVTSEDGGKVHLLGSLHAATDDFYPLPKEVMEPFNKAKFLAVEADFSDNEALKEVRRFITEKGSYAGGDGLSKHVSKETLETIKKALEDTDLPASDDWLERTRPWLLSCRFDEVATPELRLELKKGIEFHLLKIAKDMKKEILELEGAKWQVELLAGFSDEVQEKVLLSTIKGRAKMSEQISMLAQAWLEGDAEKFKGFLIEQRLKDDSIKGYWEKLLDERNVAMTEKIEGYLKSKEPYFVAVGCLHLVGDKGIVKLLEDKNYKVERIKKDG